MTKDLRKAVEADEAPSQSSCSDPKCPAGMTSCRCRSGADLASSIAAEFGGDSVAFGVTPDADIVGRLSQSLPDVQRTLNWVHLASRFPVRVRIKAGPNNLFRLGESAVVIIHSESAHSGTR